LDLAGTKASVVQMRAEAKDYIDIDALMAKGKVDCEAKAPQSTQQRVPTVIPAVDGAAAIRARARQNRLEQRHKTRDADHGIGAPQSLEQDKGRRQDFSLGIDEEPAE
jgi:hypothetical protein